MENFRYLVCKKKSGEVPHKLTESLSVKKNKSLEFFEYPPHRRYFCQLCKQEVTICLNCDRYHKYCPSCKKQSILNSNKKSNDKYRKTENGKEKRALCEKRRRDKIMKELKNLNNFKTVGEKSTNISQDLPNSKIEATSASEKINPILERETNHVFVGETQIVRGGELGFSAIRGNSKKILCAYCSKECSPYTYSQVLSNETYKKRYRTLRKKYKDAL